MDNKINNRQSGIELLKVLAIILIILFHISNSLVKFIDYENSGIKSIMIWIFRNVGNIGNTIFVICSSWFLIDKNKEINYDKPIQLLLDSCFVSLIVFIVFMFYDKTIFSINSLISNFFPDVFGNVWFVPCYVIFYSISPLLLSTLTYLDRKKHFIFCCLSFLLYGVLGLFTLQPFYSQLTEFCLIYYLVAYFKKYKNDFNVNIKKNVFLLIVLTSIYIYYLVCCNVDNFNMNYMFNIITTPICIYLFNIFNSFKFKSRTINIISSFSFTIYCFHENVLLRNSVRNTINEFLLLVLNNNYVVVLFAHFIIVFIISILFSYIYSITFKKITIKISHAIVNKVSLFIDNILYR